MTQAHKPVAQIVAAIQALDLEPIKLKLADPEEGQGWSREYVERMELAYKRFLTLLVKFPHETIAPTKDVDKFWHAHILDTQKYAVDCDSVFGYFLHHFPYFGMRGEQDAADLRAAAARMHEIYAREFGESMSGAAPFCMAARPSSQNDSTFCMAAASASAFCMAAQPRKDSAFCMAAAPGSAFCMAARPALKNDSAFCMAARSG